jgi:hypothetical protein
MRTTLDIDDDILTAAKDLARAEGRSMGHVISDLARRGLTQPAFADPAAGFAEAQSAYSTDDWPMFPRRGGPPVTPDLIRRIEDELDAADATPYDFARHAPREFDDAGRAELGQAGVGPVKSGQAQ